MQTVVSENSTVYTILRHTNYDARSERVLNQYTVTHTCKISLDVHVYDDERQLSSLARCACAPMVIATLLAIELEQLKL